MTDEHISQLKGARFEKLLKALDFNGKTFAIEIKVSQSLISQIISGKRGISKLILDKLTSRYSNVNIHWLYTGDGEMFLRPGETNKDPTVPEKIAFEDVPVILLSMQREIKELRDRLAMVEKQIQNV